MWNTVVIRNKDVRTMSTVVLATGWLLRIVAAAILLQTLYFKFTGAPESVYIFTKIHAEPWGRIGSGIVELIAASLLLWTAYAWLGALLAAGVMVGAVASHLTLLGIEVQGDHGLLFALALTVLLCALGVIYIHRVQVPVIGAKLS